MVGELRLGVEASARVVEVDLSLSVQAPVLGRAEPVETEASNSAWRRRKEESACGSSAGPYAFRVAAGNGVETAVALLSICDTGRCWPIGSSLCLTGTRGASR